MRQSLIALVLLLFLGCGHLFAQKTNEESVVGVFQGEEYSNRVLGFTFKAPSKWHIPSKDQMTLALETAIKEIKTGDKQLDSKVRRDEKIEFMISQKEFGAVENAAMGYSLTKQPSRSITAKMIAEATKDYFLKVPDFKLGKDISVERLGNRDFVTLEMTVGSKQRVRTYMTIVAEYSLTFVLTYWDDENLKIMLASLNTINFQSK